MQVRVFSLIYKTNVYLRSQIELSSGSWKILMLNHSSRCICFFPLADLADIEGWQ